MRYYIAILLVFLLCISCKEFEGKTATGFKPATDSTLYVSTLSELISLKRDTLYYTTVKFSGLLFELSKEGDTLSSVHFTEGLNDGISKKWYHNKQLMERREYRQGKKDGHQIAYFENGNKKFEFVARNDIYEGELKEWNNAGDLIHLATYENGQEEGTQKMWYDNGKIRANYVMKNGKRYGLLGTKNCKNVSDSIFIVK